MTICGFVFIYIYRLFSGLCYLLFCSGCLESALSRCWATPNENSAQKNGGFKRNGRFLGLIPLEFNSGAVKNATHKQDPTHDAVDVGLALVKHPMLKP